MPAYIAVARYQETTARDDNMVLRAKRQIVARWLHALNQ